jgi:hypothetical protein
MTTEPQRYCHDSITIRTMTGGTLVVTCQMLVVTAAGRKIGHIHHRRDLDIPGCEQARVTWTRRR